MKKLTTISIAALTISAVYLYTWPAPNLFYAAVVLFHVGLGRKLPLKVLDVQALNEPIHDAPPRNIFPRLTLRTGWYESLRPIVGLSRIQLLAITHN